MQAESPRGLQCRSGSAPAMSAGTARGESRAQLPEQDQPGQLGALGVGRAQGRGTAEPGLGHSCCLPCCVCWAQMQREELVQPHICSQVTDRRDEVFLGPDLAGSFPGLGHVVGTSESSRVQETSKIPGKTFNLPWKCCSVLRRRILQP